MELSPPCLQAKFFDHNRRITQFEGQVGKQEDRSAVPEGFKEAHHCVFRDNNLVPRRLAQLSQDWRKPLVLQRLRNNHAMLSLIPEEGTRQFDVSEMGRNRDEGSFRLGDFTESVPILSGNVLFNIVPAETGSPEEFEKVLSECLERSSCDKVSLLRRQFRSVGYLKVRDGHCTTLCIEDIDQRCREPGDCS